MDDQTEATAAQTKTSRPRKRELKSAAEDTAEVLVPAPSKAATKKRKTGVATPASNNATALHAVDQNVGDGGSPRKRKLTENSDSPVGKKTKASAAAVQKSPGAQVTAQPKTAVAKGSKSPPSKRAPETISSIVLSGLPLVEEEAVRAVLGHLGRFQLSDMVTVRTTHIISSGRRTQKVLAGIARGAWIVSPEWAFKSLESSVWLPEAEFELPQFPGARQARLAREQAELVGEAFKPLLFADKTFFVDTRAKLPHSDLQQFIQQFGGRISRTVKDADVVISRMASAAEAVAEKEVNDKWVWDSITAGEWLAVSSYAVC